MHKQKKADAPERKGWGGRHRETISIPHDFNHTIPLYGDVETLVYNEYSVKVHCGVVVKNEILENMTLLEI